MLSKEQRQRNQEILIPLALKSKIPRHLSPISHRRHKSAIKVRRRNYCLVSMKGAPLIRTRQSLPELL